MGVTLKDARVEVEKIIGRGSGFVAVEIPFTPRAKRVLELSLEEARQLGVSQGGWGGGVASSWGSLRGSGTTAGLLVVRWPCEGVGWLLGGKQRGKGLRTVGVGNQLWRVV